MSSTAQHGETEPGPQPETEPESESGEEYRVTTLELFFDLVFVFVITQLSHVLLDELSPLGAFQILLAFGVLWWMYSGYAWLTNTVSPRGDLHRILLLIGMGGFLMIGLATPSAFAGGGVIWGLGYLVVVVVHAGLYLRVNRNILRVVPANVLAAVLVIGAGLLEDGPAVYVLWTLALTIPIAMPYVVPSGGRFLIRATHIVERHGLLVLITFGESVIAIGAGVELEHRSGAEQAELVVAALLGLALVATLWWSYFAGQDERVEATLTAADETARTQMTMSGYFYAHIPIVLGVIIMAAGLKKTLGHPLDPLHAGPAVALAGGVALYLAGDVLFQRIMRVRTPPSWVRPATVAAVLVTIPLGAWLALAELGALPVVMAAMLILERRLERPAVSHVHHSTNDLGQSSM